MTSRDKYSVRFGAVRRVLGIGAAITAMAAALVGLLVWPGDPSGLRRIVGRLAVSEDMSALVEAVRDTRPLEGRLTGGFQHGARPRIAPMSAPAAPKNAALLVAVATMQQRLDQEPSAARLHAWAVAVTLTGDPARLRDAIVALEQAASMEPGNARHQSDLAALYIHRATVLDRPIEFAAALDAVGRALLIDPSLPEARFNRALALEHLGLRQAARQAWLAYQTIDASSEWSREAGARAASIPPVATPVPAPPSASGPACAVSLYALYEQGQMGELQAGAQACVEANGGRTTPWLLFFAAVGDYYAGRQSDAERRVREALARDDADTGVRARLQYLLSGLEFAQGRFEPALADALAAVGSMNAVNDRTGEASAHQMTAEILRAVGEPEEGWRHYVEGLALAEPTRPSLRRHALFNSIALAGLAQGWPFVSIEVLDQAERNAAGPAGAAQRTDVMVSRARAWHQAGALARALADVERAQAQLAVMTDARIKTRLTAELDTARAEILLDTTAEQARQAAARARDHYGQLGIAFRQATANLLLARADRALGRPADARDALIRGIELVEGERALLEERRRRVSHLDRVWDLYREYAELAIADGDDRAALQMLERGRARRHAGKGNPVDLTLLSRQLAPDTMVLLFFQGQGYIARWAVTRDTVRFQRQPAAGLSLDRLIQERRAQPQDNGLERLLLSDLAPRLSSISRLVIVPDGALSDVPFALLRLPGADTPLIERVSLALAPSLQLHILAEHAAARVTGDPSLVAFVPTNIRDTNLPPLPEARREVGAIARLYANAAIVDGPSATAERLTNALQTASVVHFAGHAVVDPANPWNSRLVVASSAANARGAWTVGTAADAHDIRAVAVLAACSTAAGRVSRGAGVVSIASALLSAGAPAVIATLDDVEDAGAAEFFTRLHQELARGRRPSDAVRATQLSGARLQWRNWSSVVALGR